MNILSPSGFPDPRLSNEYGVVAVGAPLTTETLVDAYAHGIFPWPHQGYPLLWFSPDPRGLLFMDHVHYPRSFLKWMKKSTFKITFNTQFKQVMQKCAVAPRTEGGETWITPPMVRAYESLFQQGNAYSVECWDEDRLVGGLYGVVVAGVFSAESMFYEATGASKLCLYSLVERLRETGIKWLDTQMVTSVVETFGGVYVSREEYLELLERDQQEWRKNENSIL